MVTSRSPLVILAPSLSISLQMVVTSARLGISCKVQVPSESREAAIIGRTAFLAPLTLTVPFRLFPPRTISFSTGSPLLILSKYHRRGRVYIGNLLHRVCAQGYVKVDFLIVITQVAIKLRAQAR